MNANRDIEKESIEPSVYIREMADVLTDQQIARHLGMSLAAARKARQRLGIKKMCGRGRCIVKSRPTEKSAQDIV